MFVPVASPQISARHRPNESDFCVLTSSGQSPATVPAPVESIDLSACVAATARSGEEVHFWASLALTSANTAQQLTSLLLVIIGVFLIMDGKLSVGALVAANMLAGANQSRRCP